MINIIVNKMDLPYDMKRVINSYCSNKLGYTYENLKAIEKIKDKRRNKFMKLRQKLELGQWYKYNVSVSWLRGGGVYGKKNHSSVYGGGTIAESQYFRYYNGITSYCKRIGDEDNYYIEKIIDQGDSCRNI